MKPLIAIVLAAVLLWEAPVFSSAAPVPLNGLPITHELKSGQTVHDTVIRPAGVPLYGRIAPAPVRHIFLPQDTRRVIIVAADYNFKKEHESFEQFRKHYMVYWLIFNVMLVTRILWKT